MEKAKMEYACCGVTVGTFDGVHEGHRAVVNTLVEECRRRNLRPVVITFDPHPLAVVRPEKVPLLLESTEERVEALRGMGVDVEVIPFTEDLRRLTVAEWFERLASRHGARLVIAGFDNTFGSDGMMMNISDYEQIGREKGMDVMEAPRIEGVSSTLIRKALDRGDVSEAARMLGRPFTLQGEVVHGRGLGRTIGFPTANIGIPSNLLIPAPGVYAADVSLPDGRIHRAVVNIGMAPTIKEGLPLTVEAYLPYFNEDLYGQRLRLDFLRRLRDEHRFTTLGQLQLQIGRDAEEALMHT